MKKRGGQTLTQEKFIDKARIKHGNRYDYTKTIYKSAHEKIIVTCPLHGDFDQKACAHLLYGCKRCGDELGSSTRRVTKENFVKRARNIHGDRYEYEYVKFKNQHEKISIVCRIHGIFEQCANDHLKGRGCALCGREIVKEKLAGMFNMTTSQFIEKANAVHGNKYDYSSTEYKSARKKVKINCLFHGFFQMLPSNHYNGNGCPKCAYENSLLDHNEIISKAKEIHGGTSYTYGNFQRDTGKLEVICKKHGMFNQRYSDHLNGSGCPKCIPKIMQNKWLDFMNISNREIVLTINGKRIVVDGFDSSSKTVYEFLGDFWHGNPKIYNPADINKANKKSFGQLYLDTKSRAKMITDAGYTLIEMWEDDWKRILNGT